MRTGRIGARIALTLALAAPCFAVDRVKLKNGQVLTGRATAYDTQTKTLSWRAEDGRTTTYTLDELDQRSVYLVNASLVPKESGKGQLQLANYARDIGLYAHAARRYGYAEKADPALKPEVDHERATLRRMAAEACMKKAQEALAKNDVRTAETWLTKLVEKLPDEPEADQARALLQQHYEKERQTRDDELERQHAKLLEKDLKKAKQRYDRMIQRTRDGLTAKNTGEAIDLWEAAIDDGHVVLDEIERLEKKYPDDPKVQQGGEQYRALTIDQMIDCHLHIASHYTLRSSFNSALREVNAALALSPRNDAALAQRARIEVAANEGGLF
jgi:hypothetical protein